VSDLGPLIDADEGFCHQIPDTMAVVGTGDLGWTEKVCAMACARDGSLQLGFGLGKYTNRNIMDCYAGASRGVEQITVRASRRLSSEPELTEVGPVIYEVLEPKKRIRFALAPNDCQPVSFDWVFEAVVPPFLENRVHTRSGYRVASELVRYHQTGVASGWVDIDGERTTIEPGSWVSTRDHSWGVRMPAVGVPVTDLEPANALDGVSFQMIWSPILMERPDGSHYGLHLHYQIFEGTGFRHKRLEGGIEDPNGTRRLFVDLEPALSFDPVNRRLRSGTVTGRTADGAEHLFEIEAVSETGFHLGPGLYFGFDGHYHGEWRGRSHVDGERIADCSDPEQARRLHQIRDTVVHVVDRAAGAEGWGNCQPMITGAYPDLGLTADSSFI
jgi:hypothetical protein